MVLSFADGPTASPRKGFHRKSYEIDKRIRSLVPGLREPREPLLLRNYRGNLYYRYLLIGARVVADVPNQMPRVISTLHRS